MSAVAKAESMCERASAVPATFEAGPERLRTLVVEHFDAVWCFLRRLGLSGADVDDAAQDVMTVAASKLARIEPGCERSFLFSTAYRVALKAHRVRSRQPLGDDEVVVATADGRPDQEALLDQRRARAMLDEVLDGMPLDLRAVFVLAEVDDLTGPEIAGLLGVPQGTVASRLRRGRALFEQRLTRIQARMKGIGGAR